MKTSIALMILGCSLLWAQTASPVNPKRVVMISPLYQAWAVDSSGTGLVLSELSTPIYIQYPITQELAVGLRGAQALTAGDLTPVSGLTDLLLSTTYYMESINSVFSLNINLPSGRNGFTEDELQTSSTLSEYVFRFQVPNFGQGWNVSPGVVWAQPLTKNLVIGAGLSYQYRGPYEPVRDLPALGTVSDFDPADEFLFTTGLDFRLSENTLVTTDIIFTYFGTDTWGGDPLLEAGRRLTFAGQLKHYFSRDELSILLRYRTQAKNEILIPIDPNVSGDQLLHQTIPNNLQARVHYKMNYTKSLLFGFNVESRLYSDIGTLYSNGYTMGFGLMPELRINRQFNLPIRFRYLYGTFQETTTVSGIEIGIGLVYHY